MPHPLHQHDLHTIDPNIVYAESGGEWKCDNCSITYSHTNLPNHCQPCMYDLCDSCANSKMHKRHGHPLYFMKMDNVYPMYNGGWKCDACRRLRAQLPGQYQQLAYHCLQCEFDLCQECYTGRRFDIHIHPLRPADSVLIYGQSNGLWVCDSCKRNGVQIGSQFSWHCNDCDFDACEECLKQVSVPRLHMHNLTITDCRILYADYEGTWKCDVCQIIGGPNVPDRDKSFHCHNCQFDVCQICVQRHQGGRGTIVSADIPAPVHPDIPAPVHPQRFSHQLMQARHHYPPEEPGFAVDDEEIPADLEESQKCIICYERPKSATIVHGQTGHVCCCMSCARTLQARRDKCPICRAEIDHVIKHYNS